MYLPTYFQETDQHTLLAFMRAHNFATLVSVVDDVPFASHIPLMVEERGETIVLTGHVSKANPHAKAFAPHSNQRSLAVFSGPHAYVSATVYESRESVPTWNYIAVHAVGTPQIVELGNDSTAVRDMLEKLVDAHDPAYALQWQELTDKFRDGMMRGIIAFEMPILQLEGKYKLSQNKKAHDQAAVAAWLEQSDDTSARAVAAVMRERQS